MVSWPAQDIPESEKNEEFAKKCIDYAIIRWQSSNQSRIKRIRRQRAEYSGDADYRALTYLHNTYGKENLVTYQPYRLGKTKIEQMQGEWLKRPISSTVYTVNEKSRAEKYDKFIIGLGAFYSAEQLNKVQELTGVEPLEGIEAPENEQEAWQGKGDKSINEHVMQVLINNFVRTTDFKPRMSQCFIDLELHSECHGCLYIDENDKVCFRDIDPEDAIFEESKRDPFCERSPYKGEHRRLFIHEILSQFSLNDDQRRQLEDLQGQSFESNDPFYQVVDGNLLISTFTIEWLTLKPYYTKVSPNKKDPSSPYKKNMDAKEYEKEKKGHDFYERRGNYSIRTKWKKTVWRCTRIGKDIYVDWGEKKNNPLSIDDPYETQLGYVNLLFSTIDGKRVSLQDTIQTISFMYDVVMFQINRELAKSKGKSVTYDRKFLPKGETMDTVAHRMANESFLDYDSSGDEGLDGSDPKDAFNEIDLGVSKTMNVLIALKQDLEQTLRTLTGLNENREGLTPASSTATNAINSINASRSITEPLFYMFEKWTEKILTLAAEYEKIATGILNPDKGRMLLGDQGFAFLKATRDLSFQDYRVFIADATKEQGIREMVKAYAQADINRGTLRTQDLVRFELAETLNQAVDFLEKGWMDIQNVAMEQKRVDQQSIQMQIQGKQQLMTEDREDKQAHDLDAINLKGQWDLAKRNQADSNKAVHQRLDAIGQSEQNPEFGV